MNPRSEKIQRVTFRHSAGRASPVEVVRLSHLRARDLNHSLFKPMRLEFHEVHFVVAGKGAHWVDFERVELEAGDILHLRPKQVHSFDGESDHEALLLLFTPGALLETHASQPAPYPANTVVRPRASDFRILTELLRVQEEIDTDAAQLRAATLGPQLLATVLAGLTDVVGAQRGIVDLTSQRYEALVFEFEALIDAHHASPRSVEWYAAQLNTTSRSLARACRHARGSSPKQMVDLRVVLEAKRLLATTTRTAEAIGIALGFSEATNFVKFFRRLVGTTPDAFR